MNDKFLLAAARYTLLNIAQWFCNSGQYLGTWTALLGMHSI